MTKLGRNDPCLCGSGIGLAPAVTRCWLVHVVVGGHMALVHLSLNPLKRKCSTAGRA
ncbi:MAG: hypothetical protein EBU34_14325 [Alphaproteobacteria bacterium]|nr:hypothetical protein [Alphaproteobacteria bacterium]